MCMNYMRDCKSDIFLIMETRVYQLRLQSNFKKLGFDDYTFVENRGYAGGITMAWKKDIFSITVIQKHFQFMHIEIRQDNGENWFFTPIYVSPIEEGRT